MGFIFSCIICVISFFALSAFADEGFNELNDRLPPQAVTIERATVAVWHSAETGFAKNLPQGTAVIVKVRPQSKHALALFLTNAHVLADCSGSSSCNRIIYHHYRYSLNRAISLDKQSWMTDIKHLVRYDRQADLAAFTAEIPSGAVTQLPELHDWNINDSRSVVALGNPSLRARTKWHTKQADVEGQTLWSQGNILMAPGYNPTSGLWLIHNADILPGNSGGPLIDSEGRLVGINTRISVTKGMPHDETFRAESIAAEEIKRFLDQINF